MALIKCKECGGSVSDKAKTCPHCGCPVELLPPPILCPECGHEVTPKDIKCPNCGCPSFRIFSDSKIQRVDLNTNTTPIEKSTDIAAVICFGAAIVGSLILPIVFLPISFIANFISYYRLKDNPNLKGGALRIFGVIIVAINFIYYIWLWNSLKNM